MLHMHTRFQTAAFEYACNDNDEYIHVDAVALRCVALRCVVLCCVVLCYICLFVRLCFFRNMFTFHNCLALIQFSVVLLSLFLFAGLHVTVTSFLQSTSTQSQTA